MERPPIKTQESDVDLLLVEELYSSEKFTKWISEKIDIKGVVGLSGVWRSVVTKSGESDVVIEVEREHEEDVLVLMEDKIYAPEQPKQPERYRQRGENLSSDNQEFKTCLIAPEEYVESYSSEKYDSSISYESLLEYFKQKDQDRRVDFKKKVLKEGIEKARTGYERQTDENTDRFYSFYEEKVQNLAPELEYRKPDEVASGNSWIRFTPSVLTSAQIIHKAGRGDVDLQINDRDLSISDLRSMLSGKDLTAHKTGKSLSVRAKTPELRNPDDITDPEEFSAEITEAIRAASNLLEWYLENIEK